jgi:hypothetical protein
VNPERVSKLTLTEYSNRLTELGGLSPNRRVVVQRNRQLYAVKETFQTSPGNA